MSTDEKPMPAIMVRVHVHEQKAMLICLPMYEDGNAASVDYEQEAEAMALWAYWSLPSGTYRAFCRRIEEHGRRGTTPS